jgi:hypothetical protein
MKGRRAGIAVLVSIALMVSVVSNIGLAFAGTAGSPPSAADVAAARTDYLKSLEPAAGEKSDPRAADVAVGGMSIPPDVAALKSFAHWPR